MVLDLDCFGDDNSGWGRSRVDLDYEWSRGKVRRLQSRAARNCKDHQDHGGRCRKRLGFIYQVRFALLAVK